MKIFSGIQPSGDLTIGNYIGAIQQWVEMHKDPSIDEQLYCIVDMHAITVTQDPKELRQKSREIAAIYIACGIDPEKATLFIQSHVPAHAELAWILNCTARIGWMNRMTQFKDKAGKNKENVSLGLYAYPSLMAADILLYDTTHVPVGDDQKQHVELARDIAQKFNHDYASDIFTIPAPVLRKEGARIMSLRDGTKKMSKSDPVDATRINLLDDADSITQKIKKAKTDSEPMPAKLEDLKDRPEVKNLVQIYASCADISMQDVLDKYAGANFGTFKPALAEVVVAKIAPIGEKVKELLADPAYLDDILERGAKKAESIAKVKLAEVYDAVGFIPRKG